MKRTPGRGPHPDQAQAATTPGAGEHVEVEGESHQVGPGPGAGLPDGWREHIYKKLGDETRKATAVRTLSLSTSQR